MKLLIDADSYIYKIAYFNKNNTEYELIKLNTIHYINNELKKLKQYNVSNNYLLLLSSKNNFRNTIDNEYKANRKIKEKPLWLKEIYDITKQYFDTLTIDNYEADDLAATLMKKRKYVDILIHEDKDLLQIPGIHIYRNKQIFIDNITAYTFMMTQILTGDSTDNIKGVPGIGKVKATKLIANQPIIDIHNIVIQTYIDYYKDIHIGLTKFWQNHNLIKLKTDVEC